MRRTKIVCTMGPATEDQAVLERLIEAGMDVARLNMSHGTHAAHAAMIKRLRLASQRLGKLVPILLDLQGPKIRVGNMLGGRVELKEGSSVLLVTREVEGNADRISTSYLKLASDCRPGDPILLDDGKLRLRVTAIQGVDVKARVEVGGWLKNHKGMNLPGVSLSTPSVTAKDFIDLRFGLEQGVDAVALSFVRHPEDVLKVKKFIAARGHSTPVIAKIEKPEALDQLRAITRASDGLMVARGDLGVEMDLAQVPLIQKEIITMANLNKTLVITATQMLESMTENPSPTRAEASDVANAILDGTDAVMLSGETAAGKYPVEACATMARICAITEASTGYRNGNLERLAQHTAGKRSVSEAVCFAARAATEDLRVRAIVCFTKTGATARYLSKFRPEVPIYAFTPRKPTLHQLGLYWGVTGASVRPEKDMDRLFKRTCDYLKKEKRVFKGDLLVILSGTPLDLAGSINLLKIHLVD
ncbi:MAG TPA: pyruvate kinase [bacterium]|nr:pyruvate kinase [bacterium]